MAWKIIWSLRAQADRRKILTYWLERNKSNIYSKKLNRLFIETTKLISAFPKIGKPTTHDPAIRVKVVRDYLMIYEVTDYTIYILTIWDTRQDPEKLQEMI